MNDIELFAENELTVNESEERAFHEKVVDDVKDGIEKLAGIGDASLKVLRDKRLYRATHKTFEDYCQERFGIVRTTANRGIAFAGVLENLMPQGIKILPDTEKQARSLTKLPTPELQAQAWTQAQTDSGKEQPSNREVTEAVAKVQAELEAEKQRTEKFRQESNERRKKVRELEEQIGLLKNQPAPEPEKVYVAPADYESLKKTERDLRSDLAELKQQQRELVQQQVIAKLKERESELAELDRKVQRAESLLTGLQTQIDRYSMQQRELKVHLDTIETARTAMAMLAANLEGFDQVIDMNHELRQWRALADMLRQGASAVERFVGDAHPALTVVGGAS